uniref:LTD domain-containing protein n=1 Tax=Macrostomum lignano TaxID=282301 RepID=A0A1I8HGH5_9PLAT
MSSKSGTTKRKSERVRTTSTTESEASSAAAAAQSEVSATTVSPQKQVSGSTVTTTTTSSRKMTKSSLTGAPTVGAASGEPSTSGGAAGARRRSRSPLAISREQEKEELAHLNTQLACYIEFVRSQQQSADTVRRQYETLSESMTHEREESSGLYEREINGLRHQLDKLAGERAALQLALDKANGERAEADKRAAGLERTLKEQERQLDRLAEADIEARNARADADRLRSQLAAAEKEAASVAKELAAARKGLANAERNERDAKRLQAELNDSQAQLKAMRDQLETEVKLKTELENRVQTATEDAAFKESLLKEERSRYQERSVLVEEVSRVREADFESRLCEELRHAREEADQAAAAFRLDLEATFRVKMDELRSASERYSQDARASRDEIVELRRRLHDSGLELEKARKEADLLRASNARLESALAQERDAFEQQLDYLRQEEKRNRERLAEQLEEYNNLLTSKLALDQEILAYRQLLDEEQRRTNYSPHKHSNPSDASSPFARGSKRRTADFDDEELYSSMAYTVHQEQCGAIHVHELDPERGQFVRLRNTSPDSEVAIGGWTLRLECDGVTSAFKFPAKTVLAPLAESTVWSSDAGVAHNPPADYVSKTKACGQGENIRVRLVDGSDKEMASRHMQLDRTKLAAVRAGKRMRRGGAESSDRCSVM